MKKLLLLFAAVFTVSLAKAQVPDYGVCPDITIVDLDGNSHRLYDILDDGKSVVLDLYAEWCSPCWSYHTGGTLEIFTTLMVLQEQMS
jgi:thiol:disulfide interchange protein